MADDGRVVLKLSNHPRLVTAVAGAVGHIAARAGCDERAMADLVAAAEEACRNAFTLLAADLQLGVTIADFPDRVEVTLEHKGQPAPGAAEPGGPSGAKLLARVDRVQCGAEGGVSRMTLIKYCGARPNSKERG